MLHITYLIFHTVMTQIEDDGDTEFEYILLGCSYWECRVRHSPATYSHDKTYDIYGLSKNCIVFMGFYKLFGICCLSQSFRIIAS